MHVVSVKYCIIVLLYSSDAVVQNFGQAGYAFEFGLKHPRAQHKPIRQAFGLASFQRVGLQLNLTNRANVWAGSMDGCFPAEDEGQVQAGQRSAPHEGPHEELHVLFASLVLGSRSTCNLFDVCTCLRVVRSPARCSTMAVVVVLASTAAKVVDAVCYNLETP